MNANHSFEVSRHAVPPLDQARRPRAAGTVEILASACRPVIQGARALGKRLAAWERQHATRTALMGCSDRVLEDIGVERADISLIARGIDPRTCDGATIGRWGRWAWLRGQLDVARQRRQVYRELMAYRDQELEDLGIRRTDIAAIARGHSPAAA